VDDNDARDDGYWQAPEEEDEDARLIKIVP
jgi:hypothetical protein